MAAVAYSARNASFSFNGTLYQAVRWQVTVDGEPLEVTNFESGGFAEYIIGIRSLSFSIELNDSTAATIADAIQLGLYSSAGAIRLYHNKTGNANVYWNIPTPFIKSVGVNADPKNPLAYSITGNGSGTFSYPTGAPGSTT